MKKIKKSLYLVLAAIIILLTACSPANQREHVIQRTYQSYREIPGVTQEDIAAIDDLLTKKPELLCGFPLSTEAFYSEDGSVGGFVSLLYGRMSELFGFTFNYQVCDWDQLLEKIESKEIDLTAEFTPTPARLENYFMTEPIIQRAIKVFTKKGIELKDIAKKRPIRCAFITGSTIYPLVDASWDIPFEPVFIDGESEIANYFINDEIDAYIDESVMESLFDSYNFIESTEYYPLNYSPVSLTTANPELAPIINVMQKYLRNGGLAELSELYSLGNKDYLRQQLYTLLTEEEKAYIQQHNSDTSAVSMACEIDDYPSCFYNLQEKEFQGSAIDVMNKITDLTDLRFTPETQPHTAWAELLLGLENGEYAFTNELIQTASRQGRFLWADEPYYTNNYALISRADYPDIDINQIVFHRVGLVEGTAFSDLFLEWFPNSLDTKFYTNNIEALAALEKGEIDLIMMSQNLLLYITNYLEKPYFKANIVFDYSMGSYFGFNKNEAVLCSIISKAQQYVDTQRISESWRRKVFDYENKMLKDMIPYAIIFSCLLVAALVVAIVLFLKNRGTSKNFEKLVMDRTAELALQTSTLTTIFESIPDLVFCKDLNSNFTRCNRSFEKHFGRREADIIGKNDAEAFGLSADMVNTYQEIDMRVVRLGESVVVEEIIPLADGTLPLFETIKTPLMQDGKVVGIMGISRDITQRKAAEETLKLTLDNLNTCIYITELETGKILFINEKMSKEFGGNVGLGSICWEVLQTGFTKRCDFCPVPHLLESGDEYCVWEEHNTVTGRHYENTDSIIKWHDGRLVHMQHSVDITDAVKLKRDLEDASHAKSDFLSRMSHEIRTPLNAIIGMNNIALGSNDIEKAHQCHKKIDAASKHLLGLINDILDMSKIEADKFELSSSEFNFEKTLMNIINVTNFRAEEKRLELVVNLSKNVPTAMLGDELRLSQVITNLLSNAVKFTPENGAVILNVEKVAEGDDEVTLLIDVTDTGIGISEEQQTRLFTSFEQADGSISRKFGGTGLGLAISKRIVELMGGSIWIESELGKGAKFVFTIKLKKAKEIAREKLASNINRENLRVLAVDDSEETLLSFAHIMNSRHLPCDVASSGFEALEMIKKAGDKPYNIFFIDWQMPEMNGIELTEKIKAITGDNAVVFMISVADWNTIEAEATVAGVNSFLSKPIFPSSLVNAINSCLGTESAKTELHTQSKNSIPNFSSYSILIAEDIEINQEIMVAVLEETGIAIEFANNGEEAVSMFRENQDKYNLILMDIQMPIMGGYEATRLIRSLESERAKTIPIIAMTANVFKEDIENCLAAGMNNHLGKPVDTNDLFEKLGKYLT